MKELSIGVQTSRWYREDQPKESLGFIKNCGFEVLDYNIDAVFSKSFHEETLTSFFDQSLEELYAYYAPMKEALKENGLELSQMHGLFPVYIDGDEKGNAYRLEVTKKMIAVCAYLECPAIVVHPYTNTEKQKEWKVNQEVYHQLASTAVSCGVTICLENMWVKDGDRAVDGSCATLQETCDYIDRLNGELGSEIFGFCLDIGHACICGKNLGQFIKGLGSRLKVLHIHDVDGVHDSHMIPFTSRDHTGFASCVDWADMLKALKEAKYKGAISFETFLGVGALPAAVQKEGLVLLAAIGRYFREQISERTLAKRVAE